MKRLSFFVRAPRLLRLLPLLTLLPLLSACNSLPADGKAPVQPVASLDLQRYAGQWFEIASFPMFFQRQCLGDTTANYQLRDDGGVTVTNRCRTDSGFDQASGKAWAVEGGNNARLKVSFFWPFRSDYWVIGLDPEYRWAVVGNPERKYLWLLARRPDLPKDQIDAALAAARAQGYDLAPLRYTAHGPAAGAR